MNTFSLTLLTALLLASQFPAPAADGVVVYPPVPVAGQVDDLLSRIDAGLVADVEADAQAYLDARADTRVGPVLFDIERFTKVQEDGSVLVSSYWGRAPMLGYLFFDGYDLLGDEKYRRVALDLADHYLHIQEPEGFWHYAHFVKRDGTTSRLEMAEANGRGDNENAPGRVEWEWLRKLRIAQGHFTPEQLATGGQPRFSGDGTHAVKVANWFDIPWTKLPSAKLSQQEELLR